MRSPCISERAAALALVLLLLGGCAASGRPGDGAPPWPAEVLARYEAAAAAAAEGREEEARRAFEALVVAHPEYTGPRRQLARLALRAGDPAGAVAQLEAALAHCGDCAAVHTERALAERERGNLEAALHAYEAALEVDPAFAPAHFDAAVLHELYLARPREAIRHYERYLELAGEAPAREQERVRAWIARLEREVGGPEAQVASGAAVAGARP